MDAHIDIRPDAIEKDGKRILLLFRCAHCQALKEIDDFGLRKIARPEATKRQSWCKICRGQSAKVSL